MEDERLMRTLRQQAWERAKAELNSMLVTHWHGTESPRRINQFDLLKNAVQEFIEKIEDEGLQE